LAAPSGQKLQRATLDRRAPVIVRGTADIVLAVKAAGADKFCVAGQLWISPPCILVQKPEG
jgi:hypothetical protein